MDFVKRCIRYYVYKTEEIQTDNGVEFTFNRSDVKREHPMDTLLNELGIKHYKIRPRTPEHNGKVERSHRNDNENNRTKKRRDRRDKIKEGTKKVLL